VQAELDEIMAEEQLESEDKLQAIRDLWVKRGLRRAALLGIGLQMLNQLAGINTIMYYSATILRAYAGFHTSAAIWLSLLCTFGQLVGNVISLYIMDHGRRATIMPSIIIVFCSLCGLSAGFFILTFVEATSGVAGLARILVVVALMTYLISYGAGLSSVPTVVCSEIYPIRVRSAGMSQAMFTQWVTNGIVSITFLSLSDGITTGGTFALFAAFSGIGGLLVHRYLPETAGVPLEHIEKLFADPYPRGLRKEPRTSLSNLAGYRKPSESTSLNSKA